MLNIGLSIRGAGWHPATRDADGFDPGEPRDWGALAGRADAAGVDLLSFEDGPALDGVSASFDSFALANWLAPQTARIGLLPTATITALEPFHTATAVATLDHTSQGRAGVRLRVGLGNAEARAVGRAAHISRAELATLAPEQVTAAILPGFDEAWEFSQVLRLLWDSWEDDAEIRDLTTGRFIDRDKIHNPGFRGDHFSVHGASITPRPPQGQPPVLALAHQRIPYQFAAASSDIVAVTPFSAGDRERILAEVREASDRVGREGAPIKVWGDVNVHFGGLDLDQFSSDAQLVAGSPGEVLEQLAAFSEGLDGIRVRPLDTSADTTIFLADVLPHLRSEVPTGRTLRDRLGLVPAPNQYVADPAFTADFRAAHRLEASA